MKNKKAGNAPVLEIRDLHVSIEGKEIVRGASLRVKQGEIHALMGPNGSGKSTLSLAIMGHPKYKITGGDILLDGKSVLGMKTYERARAGLFLAFQYPSEVQGVGMSNFLRTALNAKRGKNAPTIPVPEFVADLKKKMGKLGMKEEFSKRYLNDGFSGGEKKRSEILQMAMLGPKFAILDEPDSGLDVDALKSVAKGIRAQAGPGLGVLIITHYDRILKYVKPDFVHVMMNGRIVKSGTGKLAGELDSKGYGWINKE
jgi:Fe-S cluster assembly ATP-binding protein